ncbi:hypothetical protein T484DRAFT_1826289, partial [Baffinella frigidus]
AISGSRDGEVRFWDITSGTQVRQVARSDFDFGIYAQDKTRTNRHVLTFKGEMLLIEEKDAAAPVACFMAPHGISRAVCQGKTICVGCDTGKVLFLQVPFFAA